MAITNTYSSLCIDDFATWAGLDPLYFSGLDITACGLEDNSICNLFWSQYSRQGWAYSRETLAQNIFEAENKIHEQLETFVKPTWVLGEEIEIADFFDRKLSGNIGLENMTFKTKNKMINHFGRRESVLHDTPVIVYSDDDTDGYEESARVTVTYTTVPDLCDVKFYFTGHNGDSKWEICPVSLESYDSTTGVTVYHINSWQLIDPSNYLNSRFGNQKAINACDTSLRVLDLEVRIESVDVCTAQVEVVYQDNWECTSNCTETTIPACATIVDSCNGYFQIKLQSYDSVSGCVIDTSSCVASCSKPIKLRVWYNAGCKPSVCDTNGMNECLQLYSAVFKLAASQLDVRNCDCACTNALVSKWAEETSLTVPNGAKWNIPFTSRLNPFGTTLGQIDAYLTISSYRDDMC